MIPGTPPSLSLLLPRLLPLVEGTATLPAGGEDMIHGAAPHGGFQFVTA